MTNETQLDLFETIDESQPFLVFPAYKTAILMNEFWLDAVSVFMVGRNDIWLELSQVESQYRQNIPKKKLEAIGYTIEIPQRPLTWCSIDKARKLRLEPLPEEYDF